MLGACGYEARNLRGALRLIEGDRTRLLRARLRLQARALGPAIGCRCQGCTGPLYGPSLRARGGAVYVFACGHSWHRACASEFGSGVGATSAGGAAAGSASASAGAGEGEDTCPLCGTLGDTESSGPAPARSNNKKAAPAGAAASPSAAAAASPTASVSESRDKADNGSATADMVTMLARLHDPLESLSWEGFVARSAPVVGAHARPLHEVEGSKSVSATARAEAGGGKDTERSGFSSWFN